MSHINDGACQKCISIRDKYPGFNLKLWTWFADLQSKNPEVHVSCCGRGQTDQEDAFARRASKAHFGQSAHNVNAALDVFCNLQGKSLYDLGWFNSVIGPNVPDWLDWYGRRDARFHELPHIEIKSWSSMGFNLVSLNINN